MIFMFDPFYHFADVLLHHCMVHILVFLWDVLIVFLFPQTQCTPTRGTTVITVHPAKAPQWPPLIQITDKVKDVSEDLFIIVVTVSMEAYMMYSNRWQVLQTHNSSWMCACSWSKNENTFKYRKPSRAGIRSPLKLAKLTIRSGDCMVLSLKPCWFLL